MTELVILRGADEAGLVAEIDRLVAYLDRFPEVRLVDVAYTCAFTRGESVLSLVVADVPSLRARLVSARGRIAAGNVRRLRDKSGTYYFRDHLLGEGKGRLAFLYPGVMSFYPDMMRDLAISYPACRGAFDELEEALAADRDFTPSSFIFPPAAYYRHDADIFKSGAYAQALVSTYAACVAMTRLLADCGVRPEGVVGFAGGDLAAMMRSGASGERPSRPERIKLIADIYGIVSKAVNHGGLEKVAVISVLLRHAGEIDGLVASFPPDKVMLAVDFSPRQKTYVVREDFAAAALAAFAELGVRTMRLALDRPFNTPLGESLVPAVYKFASNWMRKEPLLDVYSCATAEKVPRKVRHARKDTAGRWAKPVLFADTIRRMYADGYRVFLEVGPRGLLTAAVEDTLKGEEHAAIVMNSIHRSGLLQAEHALGQLAALGAELDVAGIYAWRRARRLDFDSPVSPTVRRDSEMRLSRSFPRLTLLSAERPFGGVSFMSEPKTRGAKAAIRAAAVAQQARRQRQFDFGALNPLVSDADTLASSPGVSIEITKCFRLTDLPFVNDYALGTSQMSYSDPNLRGLIPLTMSLGAEIAAETASLVMPNRTVVRVEDLTSRRMVSFERGELTLFVRAERVASASPGEPAVKVLIRDDAPNGAYTWPVMECTVVLAAAFPPPVPVAAEPLVKPRNVHWSGREIYPQRLCYGRRLRGIGFVEAWSEFGLDYEITVPSVAGNVAFTRFPMWAVDPLLVETVVSGFQLWRSHERFTGAFSFPFHLRRLSMFGAPPKEGARLKCYMRLTGVTPKSHLCDITVTDGNGQQLMSVSGWEELTERVPSEYRDLILQPAIGYLTAPLDASFVGQSAVDCSTAFITDIPYPIFERNSELWLKTVSHVVLDAVERKQLAEMSGSTSRRTEWLFGRVAAKEAVRRYLKDFHQARWSDADVRIWPNSLGKPIALGAWSDYLAERLDVAIAHTAQFVVAIAAANARVGVDVESARRDLSEEFTNGVFTPEELELAAQSSNVAQTIIKFWCAKEAVSKALGTGIRYSPREMLVTAFSPDAGALTVRLEGGWLNDFKAFKGRDLSVTVRTLRDHALAVCFLPTTYFNDED